jgi:hypothetical protein
MYRRTNYTLFPGFVAAAVAATVFHFSYIAEYIHKGCSTSGVLFFLYMFIFCRISKLSVTDINYNRRTNWLSVEPFLIITEDEMF